jgi:hypothetical protein
MFPILRNVNVLEEELVNVAGGFGVIVIEF